MDMEQLDVLMEFQPQLGEDSCILTISDKSGSKLVTKVLPDVTFPQLATNDSTRVLPYTVTTKLSDLKNFQSLIGEINMDELMTRAKAAQELALKESKMKKESAKKTPKTPPPPSKPIDVVKKSSKIINKAEKKPSKTSVKEVCGAPTESIEASNVTVTTESMSEVEPSAELPSIEVDPVPESPAEVVNRPK